MGGGPEVIVSEPAETLLGRDDAMRTRNEGLVGPEELVHANPNIVLTPARIVGGIDAMA
jgi:hypothetical protein